MFKQIVFLVSVILLMGWSWVEKKYDRPVLLNSKATGVIMKDDIQWHWENRFNREEVYKVKSWLTEVYRHTQNTIGVYPFKIHFYIHRSESAKEPVPWANTKRGDIQGIHFHINPDFELDEFLSDWTAPHEISHLSIPFVGSNNMWFSEGYATYIQVRILQNMNVYSSVFAKQKFDSRFSKCKPKFNGNSSVVEIIDQLKGGWDYPTIYWGGASFFWKLDRDLLKEKGTSLLEIIKEYENCCRINESSPKEFCLVLDSLSESTLATDLLFQYNTKPAHILFEEF